MTKLIFSRGSGWKSVSRGDKKKNHFMISRMMSINYPLQAHALNHIKIDPVETVDSWHRLMSRIYSQVPFWMYTKGQKKQKEKKEKKLSVKESTIKAYAKKYDLDLRSVRDAIEFFPEESVKELQKFEKMIS
ncbi:MAG: hypothetical protein HC831_19025 [Chloroflexia bacterium]|nr:hypothetical protein [Chloroflexia bacterium]